MTLTYRSFCRCRCTAIVRHVQGECECQTYGLINFVDFGCLPDQAGIAHEIVRGGII